MKGKADLRMLVSLVMAILMFSVPLVVMAQQDDMASARAAAERDAQMDVNSGLWFLAGCCLGATGLIISYVYTPSPPASRLMGKSPEYIAYYTDFYRAKSKSIQTGRAWTGCLVSAVGYVVYVVVVIAATAESSTW